MSDTFGISSSGLHPTLSDKSLSAIYAARQRQFKPDYFLPFDRLQIVTVQEILDGARMNLPLMEEVTKRAQKAKADNQASLFAE